MYCSSPVDIEVALEEVRKLHDEATSHAEKIQIEACLCATINYEPRLAPRVGTLIGQLAHPRAGSPDPRARVRREVPAQAGAGHLPPPELPAHHLVEHDVLRAHPRGRRGLERHAFSDT